MVDCELEDTSWSGKTLSTIRRAVMVFVGMSGVRLDRGLLQAAVMVMVMVASSQLSSLAVSAGRVEIYVAASWAFYYIGNSAVLGTRIREHLIAWLGRERALRFYEVLLGAMFANQGFALSAVCLAHPASLAWSPWQLVGLAVPLFALGFVTKFWATWQTGLDVYYYRDMFEHRRNGELVEGGIYRWLDSPMYTVGNVHAYGAALWMGSLEGLAVAAAYHISILAFDRALEQPFVERMYGRRGSKP